MSEEENKAIYKLKSIVKVNNDFLKNVENQTINQEEIKAVKIVLNLIEKQQKEIRELNKSDESKEQSSMKYYNLYKELVDKIKAKIEELENQKRQWIEDRDNKHKDSEIIYAIEVLQSLLEKEGE